MKGDVMTHDSPDNVAEFHDVAVQYGPTSVLDHVTFAVPKGSVFAILGRNGAGKSSLLRCLLGLQKPFRGRLTLLGEDPWQSRGALMRQCDHVATGDEDVLVERDTDGLARELLALADDRIRYTAMGAAAAKRVAEEFNLAVQTRKLEAIYTECAS